MWRRTWAPAVLLLAAACGTTNAGEGVACTMIGTPVGIGVDVGHPDARSATIEVCWDGVCATPALELHPSSRGVDATCTGTGPDDSCSARVMVAADGRNGFANVPDLPARPVEVTLRVLGGSGTVLVDRRITVTPAMAYPNGPDCPAGGPQAGISVGADGAVAER